MKRSRQELAPSAEDFPNGARESVPRTPKFAVCEPSCQQSKCAPAPCECHAEKAQEGAKTCTCVVCHRVVALSSLGLSATPNWSWTCCACEDVPCVPRLPFERTEE